MLLKIAPDTARELRQALELRFHFRRTPSPSFPSPFLSPIPPFYPFPSSFSLPQLYLVEYLCDDKVNFYFFVKLQLILICYQALCEL